MKKIKNKYTNKTIEYPHPCRSRLLLEKKLKLESDLVRENSISILKEFERCR